MWKVINVNTVERSQDFQDTITLQNSWVRHECEEVLFNSLWRNSKLQTLFVANICLILSSAFAERSWVRIPFQPPEFFFRLYFHNCLSYVCKLCDCDDYFCLCIFLRSSNAVSLHTKCSSYCRGKLNVINPYLRPSISTYKFTLQIWKNAMCYTFCHKYKENFRTREPQKARLEAKSFPQRRHGRDGFMA